ncbi:MAG: hypothetical protein ABJG68_11885 [Crocinitomicaceae bacterium]
MNRIILILTICFSVSSYSQDYAKKSFASIHMYAERLMKAKIMDDKADVDLRRGKHYYYKVKDLASNYVHISGGLGGDYIMAMWKMDNGHDLIGVTAVNCGPVCRYECSFFEFSETEQRTVTNEIFPIKKMVRHFDKLYRKLKKQDRTKEEVAQWKFLLPKKGYPLELQFSINNNKTEFPAIQLDWNGSKFVVKKKYKEIPEL